MNEPSGCASAILNLGILAHIDAGKTSLTERLPFHHGAIRKLGSVDEGNTTTDHDDLEREHGITIRAAVTSFVVNDLQINLIDTPGHPDFIAEWSVFSAYLTAWCWCSWRWKVFRHGCHCSGG